ncbi:RHS repeat-associated core domain-containing protein [Streptomyces sp. NPDC051162]|uniref:RHS repeat-associated core domain-containing protein n=1 Tax=Streptomyces sp. NPDC051162 TaxID=3154747 RepID=UPI00341C5237
MATFNARGEPVSVARSDLNGSPAGRRSLERDGWGRLRRETDELGNVTRYDYDTCGRLIRTVLPDGTRVSHAYAPFSPVTLTTGLTVNEALYGAQTFDGLGRLVGTNSGGRSWSYRYANAVDPLPSVVTAPDGQARTYKYIPRLGNALSEVTAGSLTQKFTHHPVSGFLTEAREGSVTIARDHYASGRLRTDTIKLSGRPDRTARRSYTASGLEQSYTGVDGSTQQITRDGSGRIAKVEDPAMQASLTYDKAGRVTGWAVQDRQSGYTLTTALTMDDFGREVKRTITDSQSASWTLTQAWQQNNLLRHRTFSRGSTTLREETFTYSSRNQLTDYICKGVSPPLDDRGNAITRQEFVYDSYGNVTRCRTTFPTGSDTATYLYDNRSDPCQLTGIRHSHPAYPSSIALSYDAAGRLTTDDAKRTLSYDSLGRLRSVGPASRYAYDPLDRLLTQKTDGNSSELYYRDESLASVIEGNQRIRLLRIGQTCVAQHQEGTETGTRLLGADGKRTVLVSSAGRQREEYACTPYGYRPGGTTSSVLGFDGERVDPALGWYHLGNGYRAYNPAMMRFTTPDNLSPFGAGGINPYAYCLGDPINRTDPSGHLSWQAWLGIGLGIAGLALAAVTGGASIAAAGGIMAAVSATETTVLVVGALGVVSDVTAIAAGALEESSPKASSVLGWVSLGTGLAGLTHAGVTAARGLSRAAPALSDATASRTLTWTGRLGRFHQEPGVFQPEIRRITNAEFGRYYKWNRYANPDRPGGDVWLTKFETSDTRVATLLERELPKRPTGRYLLLSGTHGNKSMIRNMSYHDPSFYSQDVGTARRLRRQYPQATIDVRRMERAPKADLGENVVDPGLTNAFQDYDVIIGGFCYSRNDSQLMPRVGLTPSTSYITPPWR